MSRKTLSLFMAIVMVLAALAGCGAKPEEKATSDSNPPVTSDRTTSKDTMVYAIQADPGNFRFDNDTNYCNNVRFLFVERLLQNIDGIYEFDLAEDMVQDDDGRGVTITLKQGIQFSTGETMKASDVKFSIKVGESYYGPLFSFIDFENIEIIDDYKLHVGFKDVTYLWRSAFCGKNAVAIYSEKAYNEAASPDEFWMAPVTTGQYAITGWVTDDNITFVRNEYYWQGTPIIKNLIVRIISEESVQLLELQTGGIDFMDGSGTTVGLAQDDDKIDVTNIPGTSICYIGLNHASEVFKDIRIRQAMAYLIDRDAIIEGALNGSATKWNCMFAANDIAFDKSYEWPYEQDIEKAKKLFEEAGVDPTTLTIRWASDAGQNRPAVAEQVGNMLAAIGITLDIQTYDQATATNKLCNEPSSFDMYTRSLSAGSGESLGIYFSDIVVGIANIEEGDAATEYTRWQKIMNDAMPNPDMDQRIAAYREADKMVAENVFWIPVYIIPRYTFRTTSIKGSYIKGQATMYYNAYFE